MVNKYNFLKFQTNHNMHKSYNKFLWKNAKTSKQTNELHILHQNAKKKNQYFENGLQQKKQVVLLLDVVNIQKKTLNQNRVANILSVGMTRFVMMIT